MFKETLKIISLYLEMFNWFNYNDNLVIIKFRNSFDLKDNLFNT